MYSIQLDGKVFDGYRDGRPFTLADAWRETDGVGNTNILLGNRVVLANAGSQTVRHYEMPKFARERRVAARNLREKYVERGTCDTCGGLVYRDRLLARAWWHVPSLTCDIELTHNATPLEAHHECVDQQPGEIIRSFNESSIEEDT